MKKYDIAVLDFETMNEHMNSPCEVAVSLIKDLSIVKVYSSYINPPNNRYNLKNAKIHKIPEDVILKAPTRYLPRNSLSFKRITFNYCS